MAKKLSIKEEWIKILTVCVEDIGKERGWPTSELFEDNPDLLVRIDLAAENSIEIGTPDDMCSALGITTDQLKTRLINGLRQAMPTSNYA
jgi:hypothetical protein